ncbi:hypothetical protein [Paenibacillus gorillae]|uniref:hypothetical protein n=1 Tax=Paenibacillus gorillae TaxID=1243662 RepID=UPI0004B6A458|nr:hypothetical protein [Paenibacillus gorillae]
MTFRPIDLQVSIPRTPELGGVQGALNQRPAMEQTKLGEQQTRQDELARTRNEGLEHAVGLNIRKDQEGSKGGKRDKQRNPSAEEAEDEKPIHPYKGHRFDMKL